jgi:hypothetical protein
MTDERMGDRLWTAIERMPIKHSGIVFRHYSVAEDMREVLARRIADICHRRRIALAVAGDEELAVTVGADLVHNPPSFRRRACRFRDRSTPLLKPKRLVPPAPRSYSCHR